jgi:hypothetical protein
MPSFVANEIVDWSLDSEICIEGKESFKKILLIPKLLPFQHPMEWMVKWREDIVYMQESTFSQAGIDAFKKQLDI